LAVVLELAEVIVSLLVFPQENASCRMHSRTLHTKKPTHQSIPHGLVPPKARFTPPGLLFLWIGTGHSGGI